MTLLPGCITARKAPETPAAVPDAPTSGFRNHVAFAQGRIGNSQALWFLIDTGASRSAVDESIAFGLGLAATKVTTVEGTAGTITVQAVKLPRLTLGGLVASNLEPTVYDLSGSLSPEGRRIAGILGFDVMKDHAVLFDADNGRIAFAESADAFGDLGAAMVIPFELDNNIPRIKAYVDGIPVDLRLDTGASIKPGPTTYVNITHSFYQKLKAVDPGLEPIRYFTASGTGGEMRIPVLQGKSFRIGSIEITAPQLIVQQPMGYFANPEALGFIGGYSLQSWSRFIVDYPRKRLILFPRPARQRTQNRHGTSGRRFWPVPSGPISPWEMRGRILPTWLPDSKTP